MDSTATLEETEKQLHESDFGLAPQWEAIVSILLKNGKDHLPAKEIYSLVKQKSPEIGLATVYRALEILTNLKVVGEVSFNDGLARYDLGKEGAKHFHHHLLCLGCDTVEEMEEDLLDEIEQIVESRYHFLVKDHHLAFHGICQSCQSKHWKNYPALIYTGQFFIHWNYKLTGSSNK